MEIGSVLGASWEALLDLAREQELLLRSENPVEGCLSLIGSAISSGRTSQAREE